MGIGLECKRTSIRNVVFKGSLLNSAFNCTSVESFGSSALKGACKDYKYQIYF